MELICIDLEASGLGPDSYPIEVAWVCAVSGRHDSFLIDPGSVPGWEFWDEFAEELHGIEPEQLSEEGISAAAACQRLNEALNGQTLICDAYEFDRFWLRRLFASQGIGMTFQLRGIEAVLSPEQRIQYHLLGKTQLRRHRALDDARDLLRSIEMLREEVI